ncbi:MAG: esterase-like activity of phytase family protein [Rhodospirillaceae bacterium]|nr:esterase-like activity of phytase family protein [Rhodospirillaceae bacterium]MCY4066558.1 esterase-like activity of phytase family protein [Rhodospirillaceae bacterium]
MSRRASIRRVLRAALVIPAVLAAVVPAAAAADEPVILTVEPVPLNPEDEGQVRSDALLYRGGLAVRSPDPRFGGFSGLAVSRDGAHLTAISDRGAWLRARIRYDAAGRLSGLGDGRVGALHGRDGKPLRGLNADAEALALLPDGSALVAFERRHRILRYPAGPNPLAARPVLRRAPEGLAGAPSNGGAETLAHIGSGRLFLLTENLRVDGGAYAGWVTQNGSWRPFAYARSGGFRPTDATVLPNGDIAVLERHYTPATGVSARIVLLSRSAVAPGRTVRGRELLHLTPSMTVDNFEGIAARRGPNGRTVLYILSDDNFNPLQRTLLLMFEMQ